MKLRKQLRNLKIIIKYKHHETRRRLRYFYIINKNILHNTMEVHIYLKGKNDPTIFNAERIDILDINLEGRDYKQVRYFKKGVSKSQYIGVDLIKRIKTIEKK
jgi:hypothetical protein